MYGGFILRIDASEVIGGAFGGDTGEVDYQVYSFKEDCILGIGLLDVFLLGRGDGRGGG
jgi:hypothetical protein